MRVALDLKEQDKVEYLVEKALPTGDSYDDWAVLVDHHRVRAYTLYTGYNKLGNKKYANFCVSFEVANPIDVRVDYEDNTSDVREWIMWNWKNALQITFVTLSDVTFRPISHSRFVDAVLWMFL